MGLTSTTPLYRLTIKGERGRYELRGSVPQLHGTHTKESISEVISDLTGYKPEAVAELIDEIGIPVDHECESIGSSQMEAGLLPMRFVVTRVQ